MCIVLLTTAHPAYALIVIDNRDEFILRPTSRPHWWKASAKGGPDAESGHVDEQDVLSSRDLQRAERGTWLGITRSGNLAVLTNYREDNFHDASNPMHQLRSRGAMVTAWLGAPKSQATADFVECILENGGTKGVGGFSLICGKLRPRRPRAVGEERRLEPFAIISNRSDHPDQIPWIAEERNDVWGLSNTVYVEPPTWPKVKRGKQMLRELVSEAVGQHMDEAAMVQRLFCILGDDKLPVDDKMPFEESLARLNESIFIPALGDAEHQTAMEEAKRKVAAEKWDQATEQLKQTERPDADAQKGFTTGMYGTQRQTVILVDWEGNVTYLERALWDANGNSIPKGAGDVTFSFKIEGWVDVPAA